VAGRYWEAFDGEGSRRVVAFAQVLVTMTDLDAMVARFTTAQAALGATCVDYFPALGWRFPKLDHGAIVVTLEHGLLQDLGLAEHYVVLAVDGRDVLDAQSFARLAAEERTQLEQHGGTLRLFVQTDTGDPRELSKVIAGRPPEPAPPVNRPRDVSGGVNVWDRVGGGKRSGRDDPTQ
jgi:hypothetical protein